MKIDGETLFLGTFGFLFLVFVALCIIKVGVIWFT